jgi:SAM-dependent methyltransferase
MSIADLPEEAFRKADTSPDALFYGTPRFVTHIDDRAIAALTRFYRREIEPGARVLDLMSSWVSHLPDDVAYADVVGHGMNAEELAANPRFSRWFVQDLNRDPTLDLPDRCFDAALICVGIQYLEQPVAVLRELYRTLAPGGRVVVSFSNRCFPTKAVAIWQALGGDDHARLIALYLNEAGFEHVEPHVLQTADRKGDPLVAVVGIKS